MTETESDNKVMDFLEREASVLDAETNAELNAADNAPAVALSQVGTLAGEMNLLLSSLLNVITPALPSLSQIYTTEVKLGLCDATARVFIKHGWLQDGIGGKWAEEIALAAFALPVGYATYLGCTADIVRLKDNKTNEDLPA